MSQNARSHNAELLQTITDIMGFSLGPSRSRHQDGFRYAKGFSVRENGKKPEKFRKALDHNVRQTPLEKRGK